MSDSARSEFSVVNCVHSTDLHALRNLLDQANYVIFELHGRHVRDKASFLRQAREDLPHPEGLEPRNWDAFVDSLWLELVDGDAARVAIFWTDAHQMLEGGLPDLLVAVSCFEQLTRDVASTEQGLPHPIRLQTFLLGDGINFPRLSTR